MKRYLILFRFAFIGLGLVYILLSVFSLYVEIRFGDITFSNLFNLNLDNQFEYDLLITIVLLLVGFSLLYIERGMIQKFDDESINHNTNDLP